MVRKLNFYRRVVEHFIAGALKDSIGNYDAGFYFAGSMIFLSGAMLFAIPPIQKKLLNKKPSFQIHSGGQGDDDLLTESSFDVDLICVNMRENRSAGRNK